MSCAQFIKYMTFQRKEMFPFLNLHQMYSYNLCVRAYLKEHICTHGFPMRDDGILIFTFTIPTIQLNTPDNTKQQVDINKIQWKLVLKSHLRLRNDS